jgi:chemotaxis protein MotB
LAGIVLLSGCVLQSEYKGKLGEIESLQKSRSGLEEKLSAAEKELSDLRQKNAELETRKTALEEENARIKTTLEEKKNELAKTVVDLKKQLADNGAKIKILEDERSARDGQITRLQAEVERLSLEKAKAVEEKEKAISNMKSTYDSLVGELQQEIKQGEVQITQLKDKLTVNMVEKILFDSGSAVIKKNGKKVLDRVADILKGIKDRQIKVEGHTDNVPIGSAIIEKFPTNWELSTARATTVVRYLQDRGVAPGLLSAEGYSEYRPVASNDTEENKAKNRRIEIVLLPLDAAR